MRAVSLPRPKMRYPATINILYNNTVSRESFSLYVMRSTMKEFGTNSYSLEAKKAVGMAVKTYAWYHTIYARHSVVGADVCATSHCQVYNPSVSVTQQVKTAVEEILKIQMRKTVSGRSESGVIIAANGIWQSWHHQAAYNANGKLEGRLKQLGADYLAKEWNYSYQSILKYYFNDIEFVSCDSGATPGPTE